MKILFFIFSPLGVGIILFLVGLYFTSKIIMTVSAPFIIIGALIKYGDKFIQGMLD